MTKKLSGKFWLALTVFSLVGQIAWVVENMYLNVFMYKMFGATAANISTMVAASAVAATLTTVFIGALSDKLGKRKIFISGGYILWGVSILCFILLKREIISAMFPMAASAAAVGVSLVIILDCVMTFFGSSANDAAFNAWLTDSTCAENRGAAEGVNAMMPLVAILAVFGGFMAFDLNLSESWSWIFAIIGAVVLAVGILGLFIIKEPELVPSTEGYWKTVIHGFRPSTVKNNPRLYIYLIAFIIFNISIQIFMPFLILYYEVSLKMENYVFIMAPAIVLASVVTALWGKVYDKRGFDLSVWIALGWLGVGYVILFFSSHAVPVFIGSLLMMCGYLAGMAVFGAKIRDLTPVGKAGMFQGVRIFSQVLVPGVVGPFIGNAVLTNAEKIVNNDGTESFIPNVNIFLAALVAAAALAMFLLVMMLIDRKRSKTEA
ncbi:MAG: MFS transporter [Clostridia bacterium]|nr:MFS transporter [Clostridia bacterium]